MLIEFRMKKYSTHLYKLIQSELSDENSSLRRTFIPTVETNTYLQFVPIKENGNLCFATNNQDLRDEFKQVFHPIDLLNYIYAFLTSDAYEEKGESYRKIDFSGILPPTDNTEFWKLVRIGEKTREIQ